jgi:hypothetical protein
MKKQEAVPAINSESIREQYTSTIWLKGSVFHDFGHFNFLHFLPLRTGEKREPSACSVDLSVTVRRIEEAQDEQREIPAQCHCSQLRLLSFDWRESS